MESMEILSNFVHFPRLYKAHYHPTLSMKGFPSSVHIILHLAHSIRLIEKICEPLLSMSQVTRRQHTSVSDQHVKESLQ